jgi:sugar phosphate isomerase/epimerase
LVQAKAFSVSRADSPTKPLTRAVSATQASITAIKEINNMNKIDRIGLQLYTVRTEMERDFEGTLEKVATLGYKEVEFAGYFEQTPKDVRTMIERYGLTAPSAMVDYQSLESTWLEVVETALVLGHKYLVIGMIDPNLLGEPNIWERAADIFNRAGEISKKAGIQFAYHNHYWEFSPVNGKMPYDLLLELCDPNLVKMEMDFCWIAAIEQDPLIYFRRYPGRFPLAHVKQLKGHSVRTPGDGASSILYEQTLPNITEVGEGVIDWKQIFSQSAPAEIQHFFVEHDAPQSPLESIQTSYDYLAKLRF